MLQRKLSVRWIMFFVRQVVYDHREASSASPLPLPPLTESETLDDSLSSFVRGSLESARTLPKLHRSCRGYPPERNGFPPQSLRSDCARSGKIHAGGQSISHPVLR